MSPRPSTRTTTAAVAAALGSCALQAVPAVAADGGGPPEQRSDRPQAVAPRVAAAPAPAAPVAAVVTLAAPVRPQTTYTVKRGDTVGHIALRLGVSQASLVSANGLDARGFIREGQTLVVPGATVAPAAPAAASSSTYVVRRGDTLSHIAVRTGTTVGALRAANGLDARGFIREGQRLTVPGGGGGAAVAPAVPAAATAGGTSTYTVRRGDTLSQIAARQKVGLTALRAANPGISDRLQIGQRVSVPAAQASSGTVGNSFAGRTYPAATVAAAQANKDALNARPVPTRAQMQAMVASTARAQGVDPRLAQAIAYQESGFNMRAVSPANAIGVMQVIPSSGRWASQMAGRPLDLLHPQDNVLAGVLVLRANLRAAGHLPTAVAAYYQGLSSVRKNGMFADTRRYVASVQTLATRYR